MSMDEHIDLPTAVQADGQRNGHDPAKAKGPGRNEPDGQRLVQPNGRHRAADTDDAEVEAWRSPHIPQVAIRGDDGPYELISAKDLVHQGQAVWQRQVADAERIVAHIEGWSRWPPRARRMLLVLLAQAPQPTRIRFDDSEEHTDLLDAMLSALLGPTAHPTARTRTLEGALEAAALQHPSAPELAAERINQRLTELGTPLSDPEWVERKIRHLITSRVWAEFIPDEGTANTITRTTPAPAWLADAFHQTLAEHEDLAAGTPMLWFFRQRWYRWHPPAWRAIEQAELRAAVMRFLYGHQVAVTPSLVDRVMLSLQADRLLPCHDTEPPFAVDPDTRRPAFRCPNLIGFPNGILDLTQLKGKLRPLWQSTPPEQLALPLIEPDPSYFITRTLPVRYDPEATCPKWEELLDRMLGREPHGPSVGGDLRQEVLAEYIFSMLVGGWPANHWLILLGSAGDGRPFVLKVITGLLGEHNVSRVPLSRLGKGTHVEALEGKLANLSTELAPPGELDETVVRQIVMGEPVQLGRNRREATTVHPTARLVMACDDTGLFMPRDRLLRERLILMPFEAFVWKAFVWEDGVVPDLAEQLIAEEGPGILNWVLRGGARLLDQSGQFTECHACSRAYVRGREATDPMERFLDEMCEWHVHQDVYRNVLYQVFCRFWRTRLGRQDRPMNEAEFGKALRAAATANGRRIGDTRGSMDDGTRPRMYVGLTLSPAGQWVWHECEGRAPLDLRF